MVRLARPDLFKEALDKDDPRMVDTLFTWRDTPQGPHFWNAVYKEVTFSNEVRVILLKMYLEYIDQSKELTARLDAAQAAVAPATSAYTGWNNYVSPLLTVAPPRITTAPTLQDGPVVNIVETTGHGHMWDPHPPLPSVTF